MLPRKDEYLVSPSETIVPQFLAMNTSSTQPSFNFSDKDYGNRFSSEKRQLASKK